MWGTQKICPIFRGLLHILGGSKSMGYPFKTRPILALMMGEVLAFISLHSSHISFLCICIIAFFCCKICLIKIDLKNVCPTTVSKTEVPGWSNGCTYTALSIHYYESMYLIQSLFSSSKQHFCLMVHPRLRPVPPVSKNLCCSITNVHCTDRNRMLFSACIMSNSEPVL